MKAVAALAAMLLTMLVQVPAAGAAARAAAFAPGAISTVAGGPGRGAARNVAQAPRGVAVGPGGTIYLGDGNTVRAINPATDQERVIAGTGVGGFSGDGGPAAKASVDGVRGVAFDKAGNLLIADTDNMRVRVIAAVSGTFYGHVMKAGHIYTVAGNGALGLSGIGGPGTSANLSYPSGVTADAWGNLVITDTYNDRILAVAGSTGTFYGQPMIAGYIYSITSCCVLPPVDQPQGITTDAAGNLVIADTRNSVIQVIAATTGTFYGQAMTAGDIYTIAGDGSGGDGGPAISASLYWPSAVTADAAGNLLIADTRDNRIRVVAESTGTFYGQAMTAGDIYTIAGNGYYRYRGDGGPATSAHLWYPWAVAVDPSGNVIIPNWGNNRVQVVAESDATFYGQAMTAGDIYTIAGNGLTWSGDRGTAVNAELAGADAVAATSSGNFAVAGGSSVRLVPAQSGSYFGHSMSAWHIYTIAGTGTPGFDGDGIPATASELNGPDGAVFDPAGNLILADSGNNRIRVVAQAGGTFYGRAMTAGDIYTIAGNGTPGFSGDGGPATAAELNDPRGAVVDSSGNLILADSGNNRIRVVAQAGGTFYGQAMTAGDIYTIAGTGASGFSGDGGPATAAMLQAPARVAVDSSGNLIIADSGNNRIRVVAATTGTFYGQAMTAGNIYTIAGGGSDFPGDGGPATAAMLQAPAGVAVDSSGNLIIADLGHLRVRVVAAATGTFYGQAMTGGDIYTIADAVATSVAIGGYGGVLITNPGDRLVQEISP